MPEDAVVIAFKDRMKVRRGAPSTVAQCEDCKRQWEGRGTSKADNARASAKRHAEMTGHLVLVERTIGTYFNPRD